MELITYTFTVTALCPNMPFRDFYQCELKRERKIDVEQIHRICEEHVNKRVMQEDLTQALRLQLCEDSHDRLTLMGDHLGVRVCS